MKKLHQLLNDPIALERFLNKGFDLSMYVDPDVINAESLLPKNLSKTIKELLENIE